MRYIMHFFYEKCLNALGFAASAPVARIRLPARCCAYVGCAPLLFSCAVRTNDDLYAFPFATARTEEF
jgi:hypothetical protein